MPAAGVVVVVVVVVTKPESYIKTIARGLNAVNGPPGGLVKLTHSALIA